MHLHQPIETVCGPFLKPANPGRPAEIMQKKGGITVKDSFQYNDIFGNKELTKAQIVIIMRTDAGLPQAEFGELLGVSAATVSNWETGKAQPSHRHWRKVRELKLPCLP